MDLPNFFSGLNLLPGARRSSGLVPQSLPDSNRPSYTRRPGHQPENIYAMNFPREAAPGPQGGTVDPAVQRPHRAASPILRPRSPAVFHPRPIKAESITPVLRPRPIKSEAGLPGLRDSPICVDSDTDMRPPQNNDSDDTNSSLSYVDDDDEPVRRSDTQESNPAPPEMRQIPGPFGAQRSSPQRPPAQRSAQADGVPGAFGSQRSSLQEPPAQRPDQAEGGVRHGPNEHRSVPIPRIPRQTPGTPEAHTSEECLVYVDRPSSSVRLRYFVSVGRAREFPPERIIYMGAIHVPQVGDLYFHKADKEDDIIGSPAWLYKPFYRNGQIVKNFWFNISPYYTGDYAHKVPHPSGVARFLAHTTKNMEPTWVKDSTWKNYARPYTVKPKRTRR